MDSSNKKSWSKNKSLIRKNPVVLKKQNLIETDGGKDFVNRYLNNFLEMKKNERRSRNSSISEGYYLLKDLIEFYELCSK